MLYDLYGERFRFTVEYFDSLPPSNCRDNYTALRRFRLERAFDQWQRRQREDVTL